MIIKIPAIPCPMIFNATIKSSANTPTPFRFLPTMLCFYKYTPVKPISSPPAMAEAPNSTSPTRPKKAVSVIPISCSISRLMRIGKEMRMMSRWV